MSCDIQHDGKLQSPVEHVLRNAFDGRIDVKIKYSAADRFSLELKRLTMLELEEIGRRLRDVIK